MKHQKKKRTDRTHAFLYQYTITTTTKSAHHVQIKFTMNICALVYIYIVRNSPETESLLDFLRRRRRLSMDRAARPARIL